ncbi:hypothetical protein HanPI659440_Chr11g0409051 [Helianthus annuus]|nr:hypothetical protein HanPI659440_Chr11g0409051 [Helianthus annuus]
MESILSILCVLSEIDGLIHSLGIYNLINMLCATGFFNLAKYVIEVTKIYNYIMGDYWLLKVTTRDEQKYFDLGKRSDRDGCIVKDYKFVVIFDANFQPNFYFLRKKSSPF